MARIFISGSSTGLGLMAGQLLLAQGHDVVLHARDRGRAEDTRREAPGASGIVVGDLAALAAMRDVAEQANALGPFDAVIHNAAVGYQEPRRIETVDGLPHVFAVNTLAAYVLTALIARPERLIYLSSGLHHGAGTGLDDLLWQKRRWNGTAAYSESKLQDVLLAFAVARRWKGVLSNALEPGWVATRMGGPGAPGDLGKAPVTQAWLATSDEALARSSGAYFYHQAIRDHDPAADALDNQEALLDACARLSGVTLADS